MHSIFYIQQNIYQKLTIRDVKEHVKEQIYKKHESVCSCFLEIYKYYDYIFLDVRYRRNFKDSDLLNNQIQRQNRENRQQIRDQTAQHQREINRIINENKRRETQFNEERRVNREKFENIEYQRNQERIENNERIKTIQNEKMKERGKEMKIKKI